MPGKKQNNNKSGAARWHHFLRNSFDRAERDFDFKIESLRPSAISCNTSISRCIRAKMRDDNVIFVDFVNRERIK